MVHQSLLQLTGKTCTTIFVTLILFNCEVL